MVVRGRGGTKRLTFEGFSFGDHGVIASHRAPQSSYHGLDAVVYADGNIGPRCGLKEVGGAAVPAGTLAGLGYYSLAGSSIPDAWFVVGTAVYKNPAAPTALSGSLASTPTRPLTAQPVGSGVFITSYGDKTYRITSTAVSAVSSSPGGVAIALFGERLLVAGTATNPNRVHYSDSLPADASSATFGALAYFDVGRGASIVGLWVIRNLVYIALDDGSWWVYTGVPGVSDSLRLAYTGQSAPAGPVSGAVVGANSVWFVARDEHFPSYFNGSTVNTFDDQNTGGKLYGPKANDALLPPVTVLPISRRGDMLLLAGAGLTGENRVSLLLREERWSRQSLFPPVGVPVPGGGGLVLMSDGGGSGSAPRFFMWQATGFDRPADGVDERSTIDPGIGLVAATVELPEFIPDSGAETRVRAVTLDLLVYDREDPPTLLRLPGQSGNYASTPDVGTLDIVGDLDLRVEAALDDWTPAATQALIGKWTSSGDQRSYRLSVTAAGNLELEWSTDGVAVTTKTSTAAVTFAAAERRWVRATLDVDNGASGSDVKFYTSSDGVNWTQLGSTVTTAGVTSIFSGSAVLEVGSTDAGTARLLVANVHKAAVYAGINGVLVASPDFTVLTAGATSFIDGSTRAWTINQSGSLMADVRSSGTDDEERPVNGLKIDVEATRLRGTPDVAPAVAQSFPVLATNGTTEGRPLRVRRHVGDQGVGGGWKVTLAGIKGVAVERVQVEFDEMAAVP